jgi:hypothetical protein
MLMSARYLSAPDGWICGFIIRQWCVCDEKSESRLREEIRAHCAPLEFLTNTLKAKQFMKMANN